MAIVFLIVRGKVFHRRHHALALHPFNVANRSPCRQIRIFAKVLKVAPVHRRSIDVYSGAKQNMHSACPGIKTNRTTHTLGKLRVP